ncbi:DUF4855 domain-containing protein [Sporosarcina gallistercoris]|uniref:DUF4855 domain-containing protein n=1 Tax=Sporosarcina gallistercoris TaxID=2762245 RepID=A0ABR8PMA2_9BACL|nr:DUF4855 domain-containing protein [Sporosarcina gallistercoris]MBD7909284.1 DUF4855 domain-containing protein [Sporosarcina gallistercoris]
MFKRKFWALCLSTLLLILLPLHARGATFTDVSKAHWAHDEIRFLTDKEVIRGYSDGQFKPTKVLSRKDASVMIVRAMNAPTISVPTVRPSDVKISMGGYREMMIVANKGMLTLSGNRFKPDAPLTRAEMAKLLVVAYNYKGKNKSSFKDVPSSNPYYKYIDALAENGVTTGYADKTFKPNVSVNRAQFSTFLKRVYDRPLSYSVKKNGQTLATYTNETEAITYAVRHPGATVHPNSNSLMKYNQQPSSMKDTGIKNGVLIYSGLEKTAFDIQFYKPYLSDGNRNYFDTFVVMGRQYPGGEFQETSKNKADYKDWKWYADKLFSANGPLKPLNLAAMEEGRTVSVYIGIPYPKRTGAIKNLAGKNVANTLNARKELVNWYISEIESKWKNGKYGNLVFKGYFWINETVIHAEDEQLVTDTSSVIHKRGKKFIYAPHARTTNFENWKYYGFDGAYLQPNTFRLQLGDPSPRLHKAFLEAQIKGSGITLEIDNYSPHQIDNGIKNFQTYLEFAEMYGLKGKSLLLYQQTEMVYRMSMWKPISYKNAYKELGDFIN